MKRNHRSYSNIKRWKVVEGDDLYAIMPAPNAVFWQLLVLPIIGIFYWVLHYKVDISDANGLLMADIILIGTTILMILICFFTRYKIMKDMRPHLMVSVSQGELLLPRFDKVYSLTEKNYFVVVHDLFIEGGEHTYSELNLIEYASEGNICIPLLHHLGRYKAFDKIGRQLELLGVVFKFREHKPQKKKANKALHPTVNRLVVRNH